MEASDAHLAAAVYQRSFGALRGKYESTIVGVEYEFQEMLEFRLISQDSCELGEVATPVVPIADFVSTKW